MNLCPQCGSDHPGMRLHCRHPWHTPADEHGKHPEWETPSDLRRAIAELETWLCDSCAFAVDRREAYEKIISGLIPDAPALPEDLAGHFEQLYARHGGTSPEDLLSRLSLFAIERAVREREDYAAKYAAILERCRTSPGPCWCGVHVSDVMGEREALPGEVEELAAYIYTELEKYRWPIGEKWQTKWADYPEPGKEQMRHLARLVLADRKALEKSREKMARAVDNLANKLATARREVARECITELDKLARSCPKHGKDHFCDFFGCHSLDELAAAIRSRFGVEGQ